MYRLLTTIITYLLVSVHIAQGQEDIVMKIGDLPVYKSEFVKEYGKSQSISVKEFLPQFILRKVKIMDLQQRGVDTLNSFKILLVNYHGERLNRIATEKYITSTVNSDTKRRFNDNGWVKLQVIEKYIPQNSSDRYIQKQKDISDSIYNALKNGVDFTALSLQYSDIDNGVEPYWSRKNLIPLEIIPMLDSAKPGDILPPVFTPSGYSIIKLYEFSESLPEEIKDKKNKIYVSSIDKRNVFEEVDIESLKTELLYKLATADDTISHDISETEIREYFHKNISMYSYDAPRFKGAIVHCPTKKMAKVVKKYLKKYEFTDWQNALDKLTKNDKSQIIKMDIGLFKQGDNKFVDRLVFGDKDNNIETSLSHPYSFKIGKLLKKRPESYIDIRDRVKSDLVANRILLKNHDLVEKYKVEIYDNVLKTVNNSGNN